MRVSLPEGVVAGGKRLQVQQGDRREDFGIAPVKRKCREKEEQDDWSPLMLPMEVYVPRSLARAMASTGPCRLYDETMRCYQSLEPSLAVRAMVYGEDVGRVRASTGVLLEDPKSSGAASAPPCPNAKLLPTCLIRNLTSLFLRHPSLDFTIAAASPPLPAHSVYSAFHPNRAPLLPHTAAWRAEHCGERGSVGVATPCYQRLLADLFLLADAPSLIFTHKSPTFTFVVARGSARQSRGLQGDFSVVQPSLCASACPKPLLENKFAQHMIVDESLKALYCALPKVGNTSWKLWFRLMKLHGNYSAFHSFGKKPSEEAKSTNGTAAADAGGDAAAGTAAAEGTAQGTAAAAAEPAALSITTEDFKMIHLPRENGITELPELGEEAAIRFITQRDVFRFTFVRNPLTRATSAFLDKFVHARNFTNEGDARLYWADAMFGKTKQLKKMLKSHPRGEFSFAEFLVLVEEALKGDADKIENHIDKQVDLCALDSVHYDFVGRFENMTADVAAVMRQLNTSDLGIFQKGKSLQLTGADQRSAQLYDKKQRCLLRNLSLSSTRISSPVQDSLERAHRIYSDDMSIPFNAIRYDIPEALKQVATPFATQENDTQTPSITTSRKLRVTEPPFSRSSGGSVQNDAPTATASKWRRDTTDAPVSTRYETHTSATWHL
ncbi:unnamed protein product [Closterium sp. Yama58-4]|nr:unnamed protein product [Closterium sp. Yama58-4]